MSENKLIYSSDGSGENLVKKNKKKKSYDVVVPSETTLKLRIEKKGRGGKTVSIVYELPENPDYFKKLAKALKAYCGTGGSLKESHIEVQGEQLDKIRKFLEKKGFKVKGS